VLDELLSRRRAFRAGRQIRLADGQHWTFPAPRDGAGSGSDDVEVRREYQGLIRAILESEYESDRKLAELALAIHLIEMNYHLAPAGLASLFTFPRGSEAIGESQREFEELAREHIRSEMDLREPTIPAQPPIRARTRPLRTLAWLRSVLS